MLLVRVNGFLLYVTPFSLLFLFFPSLSFRILHPLVMCSNVPMFLLLSILFFILVLFTFTPPPSRDFLPCIMLSAVTSRKWSTYSSFSSPLTVFISSVRSSLTVKYLIVNPEFFFFFHSFHPPLLPPSSCFSSPFVCHALCCPLVR